MIVSSSVIPTNHHHVHRHSKDNTWEAMSSITFCKSNEERNPLRKCVLDWTKHLKAGVDQGEPMGNGNNGFFYITRTVWQWSWVILPRVFENFWVLQWIVVFLNIYSTVPLIAVFICGVVFQNIYRLHIKINVFEIILHIWLCNTRKQSENVQGYITDRCRFLYDPFFTS